MTLKASVKRFLNKRINPPYSIISLGVNCFAKTFLIKHGFKKKKDAGELTLPFDYTFYTDAKYITEFIQSDFKEYFEEIYYVRESGYWGKARKIFFSHERDFGENDKDKLIKMYSERIKNFYSVLSQKKPILFFQILTERDTGENLTELYSVLKTKTQNPFHLAVIDCDDVILGDLPKEISVLKLQKPFCDYDFYSSECYKSPAGKYFEKQISDFVKNVIETKLGQKVIKYF